MASSLLSISMLKFTNKSTSQSDWSKHSCQERSKFHSLMKTTKSLQMQVLDRLRFRASLKRK